MWPISEIWGLGILRFFGQLILSNRHWYIIYIVQWYKPGFVVNRFYNTIRVFLRYSGTLFGIGGGT